MKTKSLLFALAGAALVATSIPASAAEWHKGQSTPRFAKAPDASARAYLQSNAQQLRIDHVELAQQGVLPLRNLHTVRFQQRHQGLPVFGKISAVRVGPDGSIRVAVVDVARGLTLSTTPTLDAAAAIARVAQRVGLALSPSSAATELGILPYEHRGGILVWHVDVMLSHGPYRFVVDAHDGAVIQDFSLSGRAMGRVYDANPLTTPDLVERELSNLDLETPQHMTGSNGGLMVSSYVSGDLFHKIVAEQAAVPTDGDDFLYDPNADVSSLDDPFAEVMAYHHASRIGRYFQSTIGLDMSGVEYSLAVVTSYGPDNSPMEVDNAFFAPWMPGLPAYPNSARNAIFLGRGSSQDFAYDSDVLLHEYTHYISHNALAYESLGLYDQYGFKAMAESINEGTADYFAATVNEEPVIGEYALQEYARDLSLMPGACPEAVMGESHTDGRLIGSAGWAIRQALGADIADQLVWGSMTLLSANASLGDFGDGILQTAADLDLDASQLSAVQQVLLARGLDDCGRVLELNGKPRSSQILGLDMFGQMLGAGCQQLKTSGAFLTSAFQFSYTPNAWDTSVEFRVDVEDAEGDDPLDWNIYVRRNEMVTFSTGSQTAPPAVKAYDFALARTSEGHASFTIDGSSVPPFDPTDSYYVIIEHRHCPLTSVHIEALSEGLPAEDAGSDAQPDGGVPDGGAAGADPGGETNGLTDAQDVGGGCACDTNRRGTGEPFAVLLALAIGAMMRRRRS